MVDSGKVGVGTAAPHALLHVQSGFDPTIRLSGSGSEPVNSGTIEFAEAGDQATPNFVLTYDGSANKLNMLRQGRLVISPPVSPGNDITTLD